MHNHLSYTALFVLQALARGFRYGFDIMDATELPSGTVYPALRRLEDIGLVQSSWQESQKPKPGPRRRYYQLTDAGQSALVEAENRFRAVERLFNPVRDEK